MWGARSKMGLSMQFEKVPCGLYTSKSGIVMGNAALH